MSVILQSPFKLRANTRKVTRNSWFRQPTPYGARTFSVKGHAFGLALSEAERKGLTRVSKDPLKPHPGLEELRKRLFGARWLMQIVKSFSKPRDVK
jgi:hypothetical protein